MKSLDPWAVGLCPKAKKYVLCPSSFGILSRSVFEPIFILYGLLYYALKLLRYTKEKYAKLHSW